MAETDRPLPRGRGARCAPPNPPASCSRTPSPTRLATGTDFIVVMAPDRTRYTHPDPARSASRSSARSPRRWPAAGSPSSTPAASASRSATVVPVRGERAARSSAWSRSASPPRRSTASCSARLPAVAAATAAALLLAAAGSWLLSRRLRRQTHGLGPAADDPDVRVLRRRPARRPGGSGGGRPGRRGRAGQRRGAAAARAARTPRRTARSTNSTCRPRSADLLASGRPHRRRADPGRRPGAGRQPAGDPVRGAVARHRADPARPHRAARPDRRAGLRTRAHRGAAGAGPRGGEPAAHRADAGRARAAPTRRSRLATAETGARPAAHRPGRRRGRPSRPWPPCCSASRPRPASAAWSWSSTPDSRLDGQPVAQPGPAHRRRQPGRQRARGGGRHRPPRRVPCWSGEDDARGAGPGHRQRARA